MVQYSVMVSERGLPTVVSQDSHQYAYMVQSGNYKEIHAGTKGECMDVEQGLIESFADATIYQTQD
jgi:hypothetical protein